MSRRGQLELPTTALTSEISPNAGFLLVALDHHALRDIRGGRKGGSIERDEHESKSTCICAVLGNILLELREQRIFLPQHRISTESITSTVLSDGRAFT